VQQPINRQRPQETIFIQTNNPVLGTAVEFEITSSFPVREIQYSVAYTIDSDELALFYLSCDMPGLTGGNIVCSMNSIRMAGAAGHYIYSGNTSENTNHFLLREPTMMMGSHNLYMGYIANNVPVIDGFIMVQITLLG